MNRERIIPVRATVSEIDSHGSLLSGNQEI
jgi:hypothetical protein